jgi:hypothetical protein
VDMLLVWRDGGYASMDQLRLEARAARHRTAAVWRCSACARARWGVSPHRRRAHAQARTS